MSRLLSQLAVVPIVTCGASSPARETDDCAPLPSPMTLGGAEKRLFLDDHDARDAMVAAATAVDTPVRLGTVEEPA